MKLGQPLLSLCMIVRDEEDQIGRCLQAIRPAVDEIIVVDTGSTDRTIEIARSMGASVYHFSWTGSFAEARNYGIKHATGEWVLWLDADEEADALTVSALHSLSDCRGANLATVHMIHFMGSPDSSAEAAYRMTHCRLFRNHMGFRFKGDIHEQIDHPERLLAEELSSCYALPVTVFHYGYLDDVGQRKDKSGRNMEMIQRSLAKEPGNPWLLYHLASEYHRIHRYSDAFQHINEAIAAFIAEGRPPPPLAYKLKYGILIALKSYEGAWPGIEHALAIYPDYVDLHLYKGCILLQLERFIEAASAFKHCLVLGEEHNQYLVMIGAGSFYAHYYLGCCYERTGDRDEAMLCYTLALEAAPGLKDAEEGISRLKTGRNGSSGQEPRPPDCMPECL